MTVSALMLTTCVGVRRASQQEIPSRMKLSIIKTLTFRRSSSSCVGTTIGAIFAACCCKESLEGRRLIFYDKIKKFG